MDTEKTIHLDSTLLTQKGPELEAAPKPPVNKVSSEGSWEEGEV